jgi:hypothetical protein
VAQEMSALEEEKDAEIAVLKSELAELKARLGE